TEINTIYESYKNLTDRDLQSKTDEFKARLKDGETLDDIMCEAFAAVKETCRRLLGKQWSVRGIKITWDMVPFDVQLFGAIILHQGKVAEMATGEGKTLVATMPLYLNALTGKGAHLATVNDYLASRDREWMGPVYEFLGLTVGVIQNQMDSAQRKIQYACDITYGTANEFGFDYLRDNMCWDKNELVQRGHYYAIVDEADSILIDEARTPLIISGPVERSTHRYEELKRPVENLIRRQNELLNRIILDARRYLDVNDLLDEGKREEAESLLNELQQKNSQDGSYFTDDPWYNAGILLLQAKRGGPKHKRLTKILHEPGLQKLIQKVETDFIRDKRLPEIDEDLYFTIDEKTHVVDLTEKGIITLSSNDDPNYFVLHDLGEEFYKIDQDVTLSPQEKQEKKAKIEEAYAEKSEKLHNINQLLKAYSLFEKNVEYIKADGRIKIVDEFTGRILEGRRYSDGLHEAIEAKEGVTIQRETQTLATITLQNYFRLYDKLAGMTGTAYTEAHEFYDVYKLDVVVIPTHKPVRRDDYDDIIYKSKREKYNAIINEIEEMHKIGRPVLVGTISVDVSETLERMLRSRNIKASVLNAKRHQQEAEIVARAGMPGAVTISTNMAGRGTDIKLAPEVVKLGGLHIVGTERHESRRIDRQLRGRSGRQGDAGSSRFYLSLEDDLMRLFGSDRVAGIMDRLGIQEDEPIQHPMVTRSIERAQKRVEMHNFDIRKHLLEYDDVMDRQRKI
ncbi:MAG: preprotein translocase subunit SecA, partial [bacterium]